MRSITLLVLSFAMASAGCSAGIHSAAAPATQAPSTPAPLPPARDNVAPLPNASPIYRAYTKAGQSAALSDIVAASRAVDVVFLGESHNDRVGHRLQLDIFREVIASKPNVTLSLEMFERDVQYIVDEYLRNQIREDHFLKSSRPWPYYEQDYRPLLELARERGLRVLAANVPRRYVNRVARSGPGSLAVLSDEALRTLPPLPYAEPSAEYRKRVEAMTRPRGANAAPQSDTTTSFGMFAQALWDAGMAHSIASELRAHAGTSVVHLVGSFHVRYGLGLLEHLALYRPGTRTLTVILVPVRDVDRFPAELAGAGDFIVLTDEAQARKTEPAPTSAPTHSVTTSDGRKE